MLEIYTDGGCHGNPGPGAWAWAIYIDGIRHYYNCGYQGYTTNNEMELTAIYEALHSIDPNWSEVLINSDSTYAINTLTLWGRNWIRNGSIRSRPNSRLIIDILNKLDELNKSGIKINFNKVKGHSGIEGNEYVDKLLTECINCNGIKSSPDIISDISDTYQEINKFEVTTKGIVSTLSDGSKIHISKDILMEMLSELIHYEV